MIFKEIKRQVSVPKAPNMKFTKKQGINNGV